MKKFLHYNSEESILEKYGFEFDKSCTAGHCVGYETVIPHGIYRLWVTVSCSKGMIYFYDEYDCGGVISEYETPISEDMSIDSSEFVDWLDNLIDEYIGDND